MVWPCFKVFCTNKDNLTGHNERNKKKRQTEENMGRQYQRVERNGLDVVCRYLSLFLLYINIKIVKNRC